VSRRASADAGDRRDRQKTGPRLRPVPSSDGRRPPRILQPRGPARPLPGAPDGRVQERRQEGRPGERHDRYRKSDVGRRRARGERIFRGLEAGRVDEGGRDRHRAEVPGIAGRPPIYVVRQLNDMQNGNRTGSLAELMKAVVAKLSIEDMVAIAAYLGSLEP